MLVSTDTDLSWLFKFISNVTEYHQLVGVPVYDDGGHCGRWSGGFPVLGADSLSRVGTVEKNLTTNTDIVCPQLT